MGAHRIFSRAAGNEWVWKTEVPSGVQGWQWVGLKDGSPQWGPGGQPRWGLGQSPQKLTTFSQTTETLDNIVDKKHFTTFTRGEGKCPPCPCLQTPMTTVDSDTLWLIWHLKKCTGKFCWIINNSAADCPSDWFFLNSVNECNIKGPQEERNGQSLLPVKSKMPDSAKVVILT